ncbi:NUDIX hydrolase [Aquimarina litoralis]|uniref:NUDIX hydrolase n=1 Tax=Aquimarina litoralis TaxID=584605 RepID=UPI001C55F062|nr:NUDIX domain-containing protein [Aquimarina litoralis]MBW1297774.1 NUDIX domain-containing protein [Aquimarina litoralis]
MDVKKFLEEGEQHYLPNLSVDIVILGYQNGILKVLLQKLNDKWCLPGGYVGIKETVTDAAIRVLEERTGLKQSYLQLFRVFGDANRSFSKEFEVILKKEGYAWHKDLWINKRFVTLAHYALVDIETVFPNGGIFSLAYDWYAIEELPEMHMDHSAIVVASKEQLQKDITVSPISFKLLPTTFTMPELQKLHETILDKKLERSRFQKKMLAMEIFDRLPKTKDNAQGRKPYLYKFKN